MARNDQGLARRLDPGTARASRTRRPQVRETGGVTILVTGPGAGRIADLPDSALAFLIAHEVAHLVHYGRGEFDHREAEAERLADSWGGPTLGETWRAFRDNWVHVPVAERDGIPAYGERPEALVRVGLVDRESHDE